MTFIATLDKKLNTTKTKNGAKSFKTAGNYCLDFFAKVAACRDNIQEAKRLFLLAYNEHPETAIRILFWLRDIRGGAGERNLFRELYVDLIKTNLNVARNVLILIPYYGRYDDILVTENTPLWKNALQLINQQLIKDISTPEDQPLSLLAKWLPSINASSEITKRRGKKITTFLGWKEVKYRQVLTILRKRIGIVEQKMCAKQWSDISYETLPSKAALMYRNAFKKHDENRYEQYLVDVKSGTKKINSSTLFPYEIVSKCSSSKDETLDLMWNALPNYMEDSPFEGLVVCDVSGSMQGLPINVAMSLAIYISERNNSENWKHRFITFSEHPELQTVVGATIQDKVQNLSRSTWGYNTNLMAVFRLILNTAIESKIEPSQMPQKLFIISDMQFDEACKSNSRSNFEQIEKCYRKAGYERPHLVFWNVNASSDIPISSNENGTTLVSGCSPSILKSILSGKNVTPIDTMMDTIYDKRYSPIGEVLA